MATAIIMLKYCRSSKNIAFPPAALGSQVAGINPVAQQMEFSTKLYNVVLEFNTLNASNLGPLKPAQLPSLQANYGMTVLGHLHVLASQLKATFAK